MKKKTEKKLKGLVVVGMFLAAFPFSSVCANTLIVDPAVKDYASVSGVTGKLNSIGSDTLNNMMTLWAEGFKAIYPNVSTQIEGKGSSTAPPALIEGTSQLGPMSRPMKSTEMDQFEKKFGYKPLAIPVAIDALAVFVHKDNPMTSLTLTQVDSIFSSTRKRGGKPVEKWGDVGVKGAFASQAISLYGRNSASGTYGFFKEAALNKGDYKATVKEQPGSSAVVQGVASDVNGAGYSGIGYKTSGVKALSIAKTEEVAAFEPSVDNAVTGKYPLARVLYVYVNRAPGKPMTPLIQEFLTFALSKKGQEIVIKDGYFPLDVKMIHTTLALLK